MASTLLIYIGLGVAILIAAWLPLLLRKLPLSVPMIAVGLGAAASWLLGASENPLEYRAVTQRLLEVVLIIAVMGAGLKIDRPFGWRRWASTWRLLAFVMPLSIAGIALAAYGFLGLSAGAAVLIGGILAPTDPVLASEVQAGPPGSGEEDEIRFALTSEAGLNDGTAFPFVILGLLILSRGPSPAAWIEQWILIDVLWELAIAVAIGFLIGWLLVHGNRRLPGAYRLSRSRDGLVSIAITFLAYGLAEAAHSYGFVAVFVAAVTLRNTGRVIEYAQQLHDFADQMERLVMVLVLALFGGAIVSGLLAPLTWMDAGFAVTVLFIVRPLACYVGFLGSARPLFQRLAIGYFGIRGLASLYYMSFADGRGSLDDPRRLWAVVGLIVLMSIGIYGISANPVMRRLDAHWRAREQRDKGLKPGNG